MINVWVKSDEGHFLNPLVIHSDSEAPDQTHQFEPAFFTLPSPHFYTHDLLTEVVSDARILSSSHHIIMKDCDHVFIAADRNKIEQVMENLISNAVKYSPPESTITIGCQIHDGHAQIFVLDTGIGIDKKDQEKLFDRFYRVQNGKLKNVAGFGIGLYLVAEILRFHGSKICVDSAEGTGSRFYFELPVSNE